MFALRLRAVFDWVIRRKPRCTGRGHHYLAEIRRVVMVFICKNYQYSLLITKAWVPASIRYFQLYFMVARQGKFLLIVTDTPHYPSDIWNLNFGKYLPSQSPYLSGLLRGQEMLSCGQRNEDILTQTGTCHTDNITASQPTQTQHQPSPPTPSGPAWWSSPGQRTSVTLDSRHWLATISNLNKEIKSKKKLSSAICSSPLALSWQFLFLLQQTFIISEMSESFEQNTYRCSSCITWPSAMSIIVHFAPPTPLSTQQYWLMRDLNISLNPFLHSI